MQISEAHYNVLPLSGLMNKYSHAHKVISVENAEEKEKE